MKKLLIGFQLIAISAGAQISFEQAYANGANGVNNLHLVKLSTSGHKWVANSTSTLMIYNLNHTVFRSIAIPYTGPYSSSTSVQVYNVSEELFNLNPNDVEYMVRVLDANFLEHVYIYDELGNVLFARDSVQPGGYNIWSQEAIVHTSQGTKMILSKISTQEAFIYSLPGTLPCDECSAGVISGMNPSPTDGTYQLQPLPNPYPNPSNSIITIPYELPPGINSATMMIYDILGQEVKRYQVTNTFSSLEIDSAELPPGSYFYDMVTSQGVVSGSRFVVGE